MVLPTHQSDSVNVIDWINENLGNKTYVSLMSQYVPMANAHKFPEINRKIKPIEYKIVVNHLTKLGFNNVFTQDFDSAETIYTPDFSDKNSDFKF
jgi:putative pyruvate formate lyase activating enzyme